MEKIDVLVIGGSAAGFTAATTAKAFYNEKNVMLVKKEKQTLVPCGIPYIFGTLGESEKDGLPDLPLTNAGVNLKIAEVESIDQENKKCRFSDGTDIVFEKLIIATGSTPVVPAWLKGSDLQNVFTIPKDKEYLDRLKQSLENCKKIIVIGGGFIGVEMSDELVKLGKSVTLVEMMPHILSLAFDAEISVKAEEILQSRGVKIKTGSGVKEIIGDKKVTGVKLNDDEMLDADAVILSIGYRPNSKLAEKAGVKINKMGFIKVDEYMRTDNPDIFAVGDCAEKFSFLTRTVMGTMLASVACAEARIAGMNLYQLSTVRVFGGTISVFCTALGDYAFGAAGITENLAKQGNFEILTSIFEGFDRHPATLPDCEKQIVKLIVSKGSGIILGGEVMGGKSTGELVNLIGFLIQNRMTVDSLLTSQIGTHPLLTGSPAAYPLIKAAEMIALKHRR